MKSSSQLFPVELVSAELRAEVYQDIYSLKPNRSEDTTVEIALLHLHVRKDASKSRQVLFVHDAFQSHWQWMDDGPFQQMIDELLTSGYSVWLMDWRAHGSSKKNRQWQLNTIDQMAKFDLTAVCDFIFEQTQAPLVIGAKGLGGQMSLHALPSLPGVKKLILLDAQSILPTRKFWLPGYRLGKWMNLIGRRWLEGNGTEMEVVQLFRAQLKAGGLLGLTRMDRLREQWQILQQQAQKIHWLATSKPSERAGIRLLKQGTQVKRIDKAEQAEQLLAAVRLP